MYYVLIALWLVACVLACLLRKVQHRTLTRACPCVAVGGLVLAGVLYLAHYPLVATAVLAASLYMAGTILWSIVMQNHAARGV